MKSPFLLLFLSNSKKLNRCAFTGRYILTLLRLYATTEANSSKFIEGMLTNLGSLPIDRIQTMLKFSPNYTQTVEQLTFFMEAARREGLVTMNNGLWKLNK